jgi:hypothetical protein
MFEIPQEEEEREEQLNIAHLLKDFYAYLIWAVLSTTRIGADFSTRNRELISRRGWGVGVGGGSSCVLEPIFQTCFRHNWVILIGHNDFNNLMEFTSKSCLIIFIKM